MNLGKAIQNRHSVRRFTSKKPDWRDIIECIDSVRYAPMAGNIFSLKFIVVSDPEKIQKLADASQQHFIAQAHYVVVACTNPSRTMNSFEEQGEKFLRQQAGAAIQNFLLKIQEAKLATCWVGHFVEGQIKEALQIPEDINVEAILPIGYEFGKTPKKRKTDFDRILYFDKYGKKKMNAIRTINT